MLRFNKRLRSFRYPKTPVFQYITCYGLISRNDPCIRGAEVSIHHMLRFNSTDRKLHYSLLVVSIHHMLRFNQALPLITSRGNVVSIHHMLRFNGQGFDLIHPYHLFQYITCYGLISAHFCFSQK